MIVGLVGEAVVIHEDFHPLIPLLFLSSDNTKPKNQKGQLFRYKLCNSFSRSKETR